MLLPFFWNAAKGYRMRPWDSPYVRWRIETYSGMAAESIDKKAFFQFVWKERHALVNYLEWVRDFPTIQ